MSACLADGDRRPSQLLVCYATSDQRMCLREAELIEGGTTSQAPLPTSKLLELRLPANVLQVAVEGDMIACGLASGVVCVVDRQSNVSGTLGQVWPHVQLG